MINDYSNPIFTEKLDKTELPVQTFQHAPCCAREKVLVLCVGEMRDGEEVNAVYFSFFPLFFFKRKNLEVTNAEIS